MSRDLERIARNDERMRRLIERNHIIDLLLQDLANERTRSVNTIAALTADNARLLANVQPRSIKRWWEEARAAWRSAGG